MKKNKGFVFSGTLVGLAVAATLMAGIMAVKFYWKTYPDDNIVEEKVEELLQEATGLDFDLTPFSPEQGKK